MTREVFKNLLKLNRNNAARDNIVDSFFDEIESKVCKNCIHLEMPHQREPAPPICKILHSSNGNSIAVTPEIDFCSGFKAKENQNEMEVH